MAKKEACETDPLKEMKDLLKWIKKRKERLKDDEYIKRLIIDDYVSSLYDNVRTFWDHTCLPEKYGKFLDETSSYMTEGGYKEGYLFVHYTADIAFRRREITRSPIGIWTIYIPIPNSDYSKSFFDEIEGAMAKNIETLEKFLLTPLPVMKKHIKRVMMKSGEKAASFSIDLTKI